MARMLKWGRWGFEERDPPGICRFGITEAIAAVITSVAVEAGVGATTAGIVGGIGAGVVTGAAGGAALSGITGGDPGLGALTGGITGGLIPAGGAIAGDVIGGTTGAAIGEVVGGAAGGALGAGITGTNPLTGALEGGAAGGLSALTGPSPSTGEPAPALPGAEGVGVGGPISGTGEQALSQQAIPAIASGEATTATATGAGAPSTALGTLSGAAGAPSGAGEAGIPGGGGVVPDSAALSTLSQAPGVSDFGSPTPGGAGAQLALAGPETAAAPTPAAQPALSALAGGPQQAVEGNPALSTLSQAGSTPPPTAADVTALNVLNTPAVGTAGADGGAGGGGGGILDKAGNFLNSKTGTLALAAAPLALTLLRGEGSLPPELKTLSSDVAGPAVAAEKKQLALANAGQPTPPQAAQIGLFVQQANSALYQQLANEGVANPAQDSRFIAGQQQIQLQALAMTQNFIQQELNTGLQAAGVASGALQAVANAQIANDNAFTSALSGAMTSFGLIYALNKAA